MESREDTRNEIAPLLYDISTMVHSLCRIIKVNRSIAKKEAHDCAPKALLNVLQSTCFDKWLGDDIQRKFITNILSSFCICTMCLIFTKI